MVLEISEMVFTISFAMEFNSFTFVTVQDNRMFMF